LKSHAALERGRAEVKNLTINTLQNYFQMKYYMNLLLWGTAVDESLFPVLEQIKEIGFDGVEVPIFNTDPSHWYTWRQKLDQLGLERVCDTFCGPDINLISPNPQVREAGLQYLKNCIDCAVVLGSEYLMGPFHSALGVFTGQPASLQEWLWATEAVQKLADYADTLGITLALEYLNRFEMYLTSCADEIIRFVDEVNRPNCKIMFDTFHANIEEKNIGEAIRKAGQRIAFIQLSENDRSTPGQGNVDWPGVFKAIKDIDYQGVLSIEAFSPKLSAAHIWRPMFSSELQLMQDGLAFIKASRK
jgi:D-psicose/D-tagatose/L-ribulose 3-epimerase